LEFPTNLTSSRIVLVIFKSSKHCLLFVLLLSIGSVSNAQQTVSVVVPPLNTPPTGEQLTGKVIWHDLFTDDVIGARDFYTGTFGWQYEEYRGGGKTYIVFTHTGRALAGLVELRNPAKNENQWVSYVSVRDVDQVAAYVSANGGKVLLSPRTLHQHGKLAIFADPEGAAFGVLSSFSGDPEDTLSRSGEWIWADLLARNPQQQAKFYQGIAGYTVVDDTRSAEVNDFFLRADGFARAGVGPLPAEDILPNWLPYLRVADVMGTLAKATQFGGSVILQPSMELFNGKLAIIADPSGAAFGIVQIDN
jgi:predicted enzyme related to lactoylglutathione lyase